MGCCSQSSEPPLRLCFWLSCGKNWVNWSFNSKSTIQISINKIQVGGGERTTAASNQVTLLLHLFKKKQKQQKNKTALNRLQNIGILCNFKKKKKNPLWWLIKCHYSKILYIFLKCYVGIRIYYSSHLLYKSCVCVCTQVVREWVWGRAGVSATLWRFHVALQTWENAESPFYCCCAPLWFRQSGICFVVADSHLENIYR